MNRTALLIMSAGVLAAACSEYEVVNADQDLQNVDDDSAPDIAVDPLTISFGEVSVLDGGEAPPVELSELVTVTNEGEGDLHIQGIGLDNPDAGYTVGAISTVLVPPGSSAQFTVTFSPQTAADYNAKVLIDSDDPDESTVEVVLSGTGIAPVIDVTPVTYDFGTLFIGCDNLQPITITNVGNADLVVDGFTFNTGNNDLDLDTNEGINGDLPWTLQGGDTVDIYVEYEPFDEYADISYLSINSNDPWTPSVLTTQEGNGSLFGESADIFEQPIKGETDIIFAVDKSCSMYDDITNVQTNFGTFATTMAGLDADYHVAATVENDGCINGSDLYIDNTFSASDAEATITTMINMGGSYASNTERAFMLFESCLANVGSGDCNDGLVRDDATLNLVGVSDEPEQSTNNYSYYVSLFQSLKDDPDQVVMHAIGGDYPGGCGTASAYTGFYEATVATGGLFLSICATDWGTHLEALAEGSATDLSSFELSDWPVVSTIVVRIDGITTTQGWTYNGADNAIEFDSNYIPEGGSTIEVDYALYGDCVQ